MKNPILQSLFEETDRRPLTVSELNDQTKAELERRFSSVWVEGEISNFFSASSGHWYFTLKDADAQIKAACYSRSNARIRFKPTNGLHVAVRGKLTIYKPRGEFQILVESLDPVGEGALKVAFDQIKAKLESEGLFAIELKRKLPLLPRRVGVVTSPNGAAFHDVLNVLSRRTRTVHITLIPTRVQGEGAGEEIATAIELANRFNKKSHERIDVLIVGRGGGSTEDLWAFNEERVARAIRASEIPVISAVGHETDFTIADFVSDLRAPTPSAAAEIVAESEEGIRINVAQYSRDLYRLAEFVVLRLRADVRSLETSYVFSEIPNRIRDQRMTLDSILRELEESIFVRIESLMEKLEEFSSRMSPMKLAANVSAGRRRLTNLENGNTTAISNKMFSAREKLKLSAASLAALSPLNVLARGYSIVLDDEGKVVSAVDDISVDDEVHIRVTDGKINARVTKKISAS